MIRVLNPVKYNPVKIFTQQFLLNLVDTIQIVLMLKLP